MAVPVPTDPSQFTDRTDYTQIQQPPGLDPAVVMQKVPQTKTGTDPEVAEKFPGAKPFSNEYRARLYGNDDAH